MLPDEKYGKHWFRKNPGNTGTLFFTIVTLSIPFRKGNGYCFHCGELPGKKKRNSNLWSL